jgi:hypothetical protein
MESAERISDPNPSLPPPNYPAKDHPMATAAQINANRQNAKKSTGPRTPQGKAISSRNSLLHGMTSGKFLPPGTDPDEFFQLLDRFRSRFQPFDEVEDALVERLAAAEGPPLR